MAVVHVPFIRRCETCGRGLLIDDPLMLGAVIECPHCAATMRIDPPETTGVPETTKPKESESDLESTFSLPPLPPPLPSRRAMNPVPAVVPPSTVAPPLPPVRDGKEENSTAESPPEPPPVQKSRLPSGLSSEPRKTSEPTSGPVSAVSGPMPTASRRRLPIVVVIAAISLSVIAVGVFLILIFSDHSNPSNFSNAPSVATGGLSPSSDPLPDLPSSSEPESGADSAEPNGPGEPFMLGGGIQSMKSPQPAEMVESVGSASGETPMNTEEASAASEPSASSGSTMTEDMATDAAGVGTVHGAVGAAVENTEMEPKRPSLIPDELEGLIHLGTSPTGTVVAGSPTAHPDPERARRESVGSLDFVIPARPILDDPLETKPESVVWPPPEWNVTPGSETDVGTAVVNGGVNGKNATTGKVTGDVTGPTLSLEHEQMIGIIRGTGPLAPPDSTAGSGNRTTGNPTTAAASVDTTSDSDSRSKNDPAMAVGQDNAANRDPGIADPAMLIGPQLAGRITGVDFRETPLHEAFRTLGELAGVPIVIDFDAIDSGSFTGTDSTDELPRSRRPAGVKLIQTTYFDILKAVAQQNGLVWSIVGERVPAIRITTPQVADRSINAMDFDEPSGSGEPVKRVYELAPLTDIGSATTTGENDAALLVGMVRNVAMAGLAEADMDSISVNFDASGATVTVTATESVQDRIAVFLAKLGYARDPSHDNAALRALRTTGRTLASPTSMMMYTEQSLGEFVVEFGRIVAELESPDGAAVPADRTPFVADWISLAEAGVTPQTPIAIRGESLPSGELLMLLGEILPVDFRVAGAGAIVLTSRDAARRSPEVVLWPIARITDTAGIPIESIPARLLEKIPRLAESTYAGAVFADSISRHLVAVCPREYQQQLRRALLEL